MSESYKWLNPKILMGDWNFGVCLDYHTEFSVKTVGWYDTNYTIIGKCLNEWKYKEQKSIGERICPMVCNFLNGKFGCGNTPFDFSIIDYIVATPGSNRKIKYNLVQILAESISEYFRIPLYRGLLKKSLGPLKKIPTEKRAEYLKGCFSLDVNAFSLVGKNVLIVDDLYDTGATLSELTNFLRDRRVNQVFVLTLTKTRTLGVLGSEEQ